MFSFFLEAVSSLGSSRKWPDQHIILFALCWMKWPQSAFSVHKIKLHLVHVKQTAAIVYCFSLIANVAISVPHALEFMTSALWSEILMQAWINSIDINALVSSFEISLWCETISIHSMLQGCNHLQQPIHSYTVRHNSLIRCCSQLTMDQIGLHQFLLATQGSVIERWPDCCAALRAIHPPVPLIYHHESETLTHTPWVSSDFLRPGSIFRAQESRFGGWIRWEDGSLCMTEWPKAAYSTTHESRQRALIKPNMVGPLWGENSDRNTDLRDESRSWWFCHLPLIHYDLDYWP